MNPRSDRIDEILASEPVGSCAGHRVGSSREGRPILAFRRGAGRRRISLLGGCHADEPVGPRLLRHFVSYLTSLPHDDVLLRNYEWWLVPQINPDGEARNRTWYDEHDAVFDLVRYLAGVVREAPGDDIEFGFPREPSDDAVRPENRAVYDWWCGARGPFVLHVSLHGMGFAAGPWFLIDAAWRDRSDLLQQSCLAKVTDLGYVPHDVDRRGEKGFVRLGRGFCTRPQSAAMQRHFQTRGDSETAAKFRPNSMETVRALGGDPLTLVTEMPLFITPGVGERLGPPDPVAEEWKRTVDRWRAHVRGDGDPEVVRAEAREMGLRPMPVRDHMILQWTLITAGLEQIERGLASPSR